MSWGGVRRDKEQDDKLLKAIHPPTTGKLWIKEEARGIKRIVPEGCWIWTRNRFIKGGN